MLVKAAIKAIFLDSGCSRDMCPHHNWFITYSPLSKPIIIHIGDASTVRAVGIGSVQFQMDTPNGPIPSVFPDVLHVPDLAATLISMSKRTEKNKHTFIGKENDLFIISTKTNKIVAHGVKTSNGLYSLQGFPTASASEYASKASTPHTIDINILHRHLGHLGQSNLQRLIEKAMVEGIDSVGGRLEFCESCAHGKQHRHPFPPSLKRARHILDLIHSDVCGPFPVSIGGYRYFILFIDDHSRYVWVYFLKKKSEASRIFKAWKAQVELATGLKVKVYRTDGGGEYTSLEFESYLEALGIRHEKTAPETPQQNGLAESLNHVVVERSCCMMFNSNLSVGFWRYAVECAVYLMNYSPVSRIKDKTPYEAFYGSKPSILGLRPFGCPAYAHILKSKRTKLMWKTRKCIMIGYAVGTKAYMLWDPRKKKIVISRDVLFDERPLVLPSGTPQTDLTGFDIQDAALPDGVT